MSDWQPIETAPKDGSGVLLWVSTWQAHQVAFWGINGWRFPVGREGFMRPRFDQQFIASHWQPLPPPPTEDQR